MVVNEHTIITTDLLFVETRPRQKLENQLERDMKASQYLMLQFTSPRSSLARKKCLGTKKIKRNVFKKRKKKEKNTQNR